MTDDIILNALVLQGWLLQAPGQTKESVIRLLNPEDPQDVPRAIDLLRTIVSLRAHGPCDNPIEHKELEAIILLGHACENIYRPFIDINMCLRDQLRSLSCLSHLLVYLFLRSRNQFMPNQLYYDIQATIKSIYLAVLKHQRLHPTGNVPFYFVDCGDNDIEELFGIIRMINGHLGGVNYRQAVIAAGHATDARRIFNRNPELDPGLRRLGFKCTADYDHVRGWMWEADTFPDFDVPDLWNEGAPMALAITQSTPSFHDSSFNFDQLWDEPCERDALAPWGLGIYPGITPGYEGGEDASALDADESSPITDSTAQTSTSSSEVSPDSAAPEARTSDPALNIHDVEMLDFRDTSLHTPPEVNSLSIPPPQKGYKPEHYLTFHGHEQHKARIAHRLNGDRSQISMDRQRRYAGFLRHPHHSRAFLSHVPNDSTLQAGHGECVATLLRSSDSVSLAIIRVTAIRFANGNRESSVALSDLTSTGSTTCVEGQLLIMRRIRGRGSSAVPMPESTSPSSSTSCTVVNTVNRDVLPVDFIHSDSVPLSPQDRPFMDTSDLSEPYNPISNTTLQQDLVAQSHVESTSYSSLDADVWSWTFTGAFSKQPCVMQASQGSVTTFKPVKICVPGIYVRKLKSSPSAQPLYRSICATGRLLDSELLQLNGAAVTFEVDEDHLITVCDELGAVILKDTSKLEKLSIVKDCASFPYDDGSVFMNGGGECESLLCI